jgi:hypothetical protein
MELLPPQGILLGDGLKRQTLGANMPYTRPIRRFYLTPPSVPIFFISLVLALLAVIAVYGHVAVLHASYGFVVLLIAYIVLLVGVLFRGI